MKIYKEDIRKVWEEVKPHIERALIKSKARFRVEDVYADCVYGQMDLYIDSSVSGCLICNKVERIGEEPYLYIHILTSSNSIDDYWEDFEELCHLTYGVTKVKFNSPRKGFERTGWTIDTILYERSV